MKQKYEIRAAQIDLARQMEPIPFIKAFIDFLAENNYNTLLLYLEWRIRTKTFDIGPGKGYTPDELREIADYAELRGIRIIPGLATLGHAELILQNEKFRNLAELREDGTTGRFGRTNRDAFCPSLPAVRSFLKNYLAEAAEIFDRTEFIHAGLDEVWDLNRCSLCRAAVGSEKFEGRLFLDHLKFIREVCASLGKRMMMWDDMFEYYPEILPDVPRDVVMVCWQYAPAVPFYRGHFRNQCFSDRLALYSKLGFDFFFAPADYHWSNTMTLTAWANRYNPLGGLLTTWEKYNSLLYRSFPTIAMAGHLWNQRKADDPDSAAASSVRQLFGIDDDRFVQSVITYGMMGPKTPSPTLNSLLAFPFEGPDFARLNSMRSILPVLAEHLDDMKDTRARVILTEMLFTLELTILDARCRIACWNLLHNMKGESLSSLAAEVRKTGGDYLDFCISQRNGEAPSRMKNGLQTWLDALKSIADAFRKGTGRLMILFAHPDYYGAETIRILLNGKPLASGVFKCIPCTLYEQFFLIPPNSNVREITLEASGFGGMGAAFLRAETKKGTFVPDSIAGLQGKVDNPANILTPDVSFAFMGIQSVNEAFRDRALCAAVNAITLKMKKDDAV